MSNYQVQAGTLFEDFETIGDWTVGSGSAVADTVHFKSGTQGIQLTSTVGGNGQMTKVISQSFANSEVVSFWCYIPDATPLADIVLYISSSTSFTNYYSKTITSWHAGWNKFQFGRSEFSNTGGESWANTMVRMRFRVDAQASSTAVLTFDTFYMGIYNRPKIIFSFDDVIDTVYSVAYPYMRPYGLISSIFLVSDYVGQASRMTLAQITEMYNAGHDVSNHTKTHGDLATMNYYQVLNELQTCDTYLKANNFVRNDCHKMFAYPLGSYNDTVLQAVTAMNMTLARTTTQGFQANAIDNNQLIYRCSVNNGVTLATAKGYVDTVIGNGGVLNFVFHNLTASPSVSTDWLIADFQALVDYVQGKVSGNQVDVVTFTDWYRGLTTSRKIS